MIIRFTYPLILHTFASLQKIKPPLSQANSVAVEFGAKTKTSNNLQTSTTTTKESEDEVQDENFRTIPSKTVPFGHKTKINLSTSKPKESNHRLETSRKTTTTVDDISSSTTSEKSTAKLRFGQKFPTTTSSTQSSAHGSSLNILFITSTTPKTSTTSTTTQLHLTNTRSSTSTTVRTTSTSKRTTKSTTITSVPLNTSRRRSTTQVCVSIFNITSVNFYYILETILITALKHLLKQSISDFFSTDDSQINTNISKNNQEIKSASTSPTISPASYKIFNKASWRTYKEGKWEQRPKRRGYQVCFDRFSPTV